MKTKEELMALKEEYEAIGKKLTELSADELCVVTGGNSWSEYWGECDYGHDSGSGMHPDFPSNSGKWSDYWGEC